MSNITTNSRAQVLEMPDMDRLHESNEVVLPHCLPEGFLLEKSNAEIMDYLTGSVGVRMEFSSEGS